MRMVGRDDFLGHQAPMGNRSHRVAVIVQAIANIAFFTVHGTMGITHQPELGRTSTESNCFRMHPEDYVTRLSSSHSFDSGTQMGVAERNIPPLRQCSRSNQASKSGYFRTDSTNSRRARA